MGLEKPKLDLGLKHLSMSSVRLYLENKNLFFKKYVLKEYDDETTRAMFVGKVVHEWLAWFYQDKMDGKKTDWKKYEKKLDKYIAKKSINLNEDDRKGLAKIIKEIKQTIEFYKKDGNYEMYHPIAVEQAIVAPVYDINGERIDLPVKGVIDLILQTEKTNIVEDHKIVSSFSQIGSITYTLQAYYYFFLILAVDGEKPPYAVFDEIKKTKNRDGSPQVRQYIVQYNQTDLELFQVFYDAMSRVLTGKQKELEMIIPNPYHYIHGKESWQTFVDNQPMIRKMMY